MVAGLCRFESLKDGSIDLADIALMNDALAVKADNEARRAEAIAREQRNGS